MIGFQVTLTPRNQYLKYSKWFDTLKTDLVFLKFPYSFRIKAVMALHNFLYFLIFANFHDFLGKVLELFPVAFFVVFNLDFHFQNGWLYKDKKAPVYFTAIGHVRTLLPRSEFELRLQISVLHHLHKSQTSYTYYKIYREKFKDIYILSYFI